MSKKRNMLCQQHLRMKENLINYTLKKIKKRRPDLTRMCGFWVRGISGQIYQIGLDPI